MLTGALGEPVRRPPLESLGIGVDAFLIYLPLALVEEEVAFRGALDAHVHHPGEAYGVWSAVFVSALWGLWHYPIEGSGNPLATVGQLLLLHIPLGVILSLGWRKSGNLLVPGITHAFMDAVRNAIFSPSN
jgi:membrane protease YdiL (CAAX protease family)